MLPPFMSLHGNFSPQTILSGSTYSLSMSSHTHASHAFIPKTAWKLLSQESAYLGCEDIFTSKICRLLWKLIINSHLLEIWMATDILNHSFLPETFCSLGFVRSGYPNFPSTPLASPFQTSLSTLSTFSNF